MSWVFFFVQIVLILSLIVRKEGTAVLENLVSSRIRRTLLEHVLQHPQDRFYLRGLAKELHLSITPLRRELKRLECSGMLQVIPEGNMLFYSVNTASPGFIQLRHAGSHVLDLVVPAPPTTVASQSLQSVTPISAEAAQPAPIAMEKTVIHASASARRLPRQPIVLGLMGTSTALVLMLVGVSSYMMQMRQHSPEVQQYLTAHQNTTTVPVQTSSRVMQGGRWRITPGGSGGFSASLESEPVSR